MKHRLLIPMMVFANMICNSPVSGQTNEISLKQIMVDAGNHIARIERNQYKVSKLEINLMFAEPKYTYVYLAGGRKYQVLAVGERSRVSDMSVKVLDKDNNTLQDLSNNSNHVEGEFVAPATGFYTFEFKVGAFFNGYSAARYLLVLSFR